MEFNSEISKRTLFVKNNGNARFSTPESNTDIDQEKEKEKDIHSEDSLNSIESIRNKME